MKHSLRLHLRLFLTALLLPLAARAQFFENIPTAIPATCGMVYKDTLVAAADGSKLVTQLYLPDTQEPFPVVVWRSPYLNFPTGDWMKGARDYAQRGIGVVIQRCRGTGGSEGVFQPNIYERKDGLALLEWLQEAPWCKSIGLTGCSYMGLTSWIVADALPSKVKGIYLEHYGVDRHLSAYSSGLFRQDILTAWAIGNATEPIRKPTEFTTDFKYGDQMLYMPQVTMDEDLLGAPLPWYRDWITHTDYTDPYWHTGFWELLKSIPPKITVPMTIVAGHFDHHMEGTLLGYELLPEETKAKIYFFTSLRFFGQDAGHNPFSTQPNKTGKTFAQYIQAQKDCCAYYGIPVLDQFSLQGINEFNYSQYYLPDRLHMNEDGYRAIGPVQADFLATGR